MSEPSAQPADRKALIRRWFEEAWSKGREEAIDEMFAGDGVAYGLVDETGAPRHGTTSTS
ncbi:MAG TPA: hypothetical protein VEZ40_12255 [Pyrinomonadaceae bacterium]|nr:hypothetical protein [Pyrinomonadaceae bacterium]